MAYAFSIPFFLVSKSELCKGISYKKEIKNVLFFLNNKLFPKFPSLQK